jgi:aspartate kinase
MKVFKFGGTSVGSAERIKNVAKLISTKESKIVVLSAMSGTTNTLVEINEYIKNSNMDSAISVIHSLEDKYYKVVTELLTKQEYIETANKLVKDIFIDIVEVSKKEFSVENENIILSKGEFLSTNFMNFYLNEQGYKCELLNSLEFMKTNENGEPDETYIAAEIAKVLENKTSDLYITQGFIAMDCEGCVSNLERGGSDYTASLIGAAVRADEIQIWTDIDGMHNNDPRFVEGTKAIPELSFEEAAELAYFGAKILHPTCILPAKSLNIPVVLKNTMQPQAHGTRISRNKDHESKIKAIAAKDNITVINIQSGRMLLAYGFMRKIFEIFEKYKTSIDMVTTAEVGVSLSIDNTENLHLIENELKQLGTVEVHKDQVIICVVGDLSFRNKALSARTLDALTHIPLRMISYGGSEHNISVILSKDHKEDALKSLNKKLFEN